MECAMNDQHHTDDQHAPPCDKPPSVPLQPVVQPSDWPEDFPDENGSYLGKCFQCGNGFIGHKHRMICKLCDDANKRKWDAMTEEEKTAARIKMAQAAADIFGRLNQGVEGLTAAKENT